MPPLLDTEPLRPARFVDRPNRFQVEYEDESARRLAYVANPGKMGELLLGETTLLLADRPHTKTGVELVAVTWKRRWPGDRPRTVFLNTGRINDLAGALLERRLIPELADATIVRREYPWRGSRVDFLLERRGRPFLLEVKSVTLVEHGVAFFPDARTTRGRHHLELLAARDRDHDAGILFLIQGRAGSFVPDVHNDLEFARSFAEHRDSLELLPYAISPQRTSKGQVVFRGAPRRVPIDDERLHRGLAEPGLVLELFEPERGAATRDGILRVRDPLADRGLAPLARSVPERGKLLRLDLRACASPVDDILRRLLAAGAAPLSNDATNGSQLLRLPAPSSGCSPYRTAAFQRVLISLRAGETASPR